MGITLRWEGESLKEQCGTSYFAQRIVSVWNGLLWVVVEADTTVAL